MVEESVYKFISRKSVEQPMLPYAFQDPQIAGRRDVRYTLWDEEIPYSRKEKLALALMEQIVFCTEKDSSTKELQQMLQEKPIYLYLINLTSRIRLYLSEKLVDDKRLYSFALQLTTESEQEEEVKLGMTILGFFENDLTRKILRTLGLHSALTLYALEASKNFIHHNQFVYEIAQHTSGYGKVAALQLLRPLQSSQKEWVFEHGAINEIVPNMSAILCLKKVDMAAFYQDLILTKDNLSKLAYILAYAMERNDIQEFEQGLLLVEEFIKIAWDSTTSFIELAAFLVIEDQILHNRRDSGENLEITNLKWQAIVLDELNMPREKTSLITLALEKLKIRPDFEDFHPLLKRDLFDMEILKFVLIRHIDDYVMDVYEYLQRVLPEEVLHENPQDISDEEIHSEHKPDMWLQYLLEGLRKEKKNEEAFYIRCLTARFPDVRMEAIHALRSIKFEWSEKVLLALEYALEIEPVEKIKRQLLHLMDKSIEKEKAQQYIDVSVMKLTTSPTDICLLRSQVAGTSFRDLMVVEGRIKAGDLLRLVREPDNKHDEKAILITTEDGYVVGYIPKVDNAMPASMVDAGESLYAVLLSDSLEKGKPDIQIMLSKKPKQVAKVIKFPLE